MNRGGSSDHGVGAEDHLFARTHPRGAKREKEAVRGIPYTKGVARVQEQREVLLESREILLKDEGSAATDVPEQFHVLCFVRCETFG